MNNDHCTFCKDKWICKGECSRCEREECQYNRDGYCLDIKALKQSNKQTGCICFTGKKNNLKKE